jgi:hypothetical protein
LHIFDQGGKNISKTLKTFKTQRGFAGKTKNPNFLVKNQGGVKTVVGSELSLVSGQYHENKVIAVMAMA